MDVSVFVGKTDAGAYVFVKKNKKKGDKIV